MGHAFFYLSFCRDGSKPSVPYKGQIIIETDIRHNK